MSIARQFGLDVDYDAFKKRVNVATDKGIVAAVDRPSAKDAEIKRLTALVGSLTLEVAELRARVTPVANAPANKANAANTDRKAYQRELMRKRRAADRAAKNG